MGEWIELVYFFLLDVELGTDGCFFFFCHLRVSCADTGSGGSSHHSKATGGDGGSIGSSNETSGKHRLHQDFAGADLSMSSSPRLKISTTH